MAREGEVQWMRVMKQILVGARQLHGQLFQEPFEAWDQLKNSFV